MVVECGCRSGEQNHAGIRYNTAHAYINHSCRRQPRHIMTPCGCMRQCVDTTVQPLLTICCKQERRTKPWRRSDSFTVSGDFAHTLQEMRQKLRRREEHERMSTGAMSQVSLHRDHVCVYPGVKDYSLGGTVHSWATFDECLYGRRCCRSVRIPSQQMVLFSPPLRQRWRSWRQRVLQQQALVEHSSNQAAEPMHLGRAWVCLHTVILGMCPEQFPLRHKPSNSSRRNRWAGNKWPAAASWGTYDPRQKTLHASEPGCTNTPGPQRQTAHRWVQGAYRRF